MSQLRTITMMILAILLLTTVAFAGQTTSGCSDPNAIIIDFPENELLVAGNSCSVVIPHTRSTSVNTPTAGIYEVFSVANRGHPGQSQTHEEYKLNLNGQTGLLISRDDSNPSAITTRTDYLGDYTLRSGSNSFQVQQTHTCSAGGQPQSIEVTRTCLVLKTPITPPIVTCSRNLDCGSPSTTPFCSSLTHTIQTITPTCLSPGTLQSSCVLRVQNEQNTCNNICSSQDGCDSTQCSDGADNDQDGLIDFPQDPGCSSVYDNNEYNAPIGCYSNTDCGSNEVDYSCNTLDFDTTYTTYTCTNASQPGASCQVDVSTSSQTCNSYCSLTGCDNTQCSDGQDNDLDGYVDYPEDPDCSAPSDNSENYFTAGRTQCSDGLDNDGDRLIDMYDPDCTNPMDDTEDNFNPGNTQCSDGLDNDGDLYIDLEDPECTSLLDNTENGFTPGRTQCSDGADNDHDGSTDFPADVSCTSLADNDERYPLTSCQDGIDNDQDGYVDYPEDPDCTNPQDEENHFDGGNTQCSDGQDNDLDGYVDYPFDPDCVSIQDNTEDQFTPGNTQCSDGVDNDLDGATDYPADASCSSLMDNDEKYPLTTCQDGLDNDGDNLVDAMDPDCTTPQDDEDTFDPGYTQCSDGADNDNDNYVDMNDVDCTSPMDDTEDNFTPGNTQCSDGVDNDGDLYVDLHDVDCTSLMDDTEDNFNPGLTQCSDGVDNDGDLTVDLTDVDCDNAMDNTEDNFNPGLTQCSDGVDNDNDLYVDLLDPDCDSPADNTEDQFTPGLTQCSDRVDNDNDLYFDMNDVDCTSPMDDSEDNFNPGLTTCSDGIDNDEDIVIDEADPSCHTDGNQTNNVSYDPALTEDEFNPGWTECSDGLDNDGDGLADLADADCNAIGYGGVENQFNSHVHTNYDVQKEHIRLVTYDHDPVTGDEVYFQLNNDGDYDIDNVVVTAYVPELGEWDRVGPIDLGTDDIYNGAFELYLNDAPQGFYNLRLSLTGQGSNGGYTKARWVEIYVTN